MLKGTAIVARRYAEALYDLAAETGMVDRMEKELEAVCEAVRTSAELKKILHHPRITAEEKKGLIKDLFGGKVSPVMENFLYLLVDRKRETLLEEIRERFVDLANKARNIVRAEVTSAVELTAKEKEELQKVLGQITGKNVKVSYQVDPGVIGGVVVRIGDRVIDGSLRARLAAMREHLRKVG
ncbi:F0F1 ATP synthase subunit delta [Desulfovirgula thermocuniculi]|uniref:F0F1 ATP synthase subunit delta n=1 Tax=Desulfovirgula thermocuniculi TaxID=348842 RepID=UPI00040CCDD2|nr:F0F1 ATP synthase subunit delta [Desulfovirgula thermocuniculi]